MLKDEELFTKETDEESKDVNKSEMFKWPNYEVLDEDDGDYT